MKKVVVCGAGIGGLVSAVLLAAKGHHVEIFEKNLKPGGKVNEYFRNGYRFDTGPSLITLHGAIRDFFSDIGRNIEDYIELIEPEITTKYFWSGGTIFNSYSDEKKLRNELKEVFGEPEEKNFFSYLKYGKRFYDLSKDNFLKEEFKIRNYVTRDGMKNATKFISGKSINDLSNKFFKDNRLRQLMDRFAAYNGSSPYLSPQFFSIISYVEHEFGAWHVKGGMYEIVRSLVRLCDETGVRINAGYELKGIEHYGRSIKKLSFDSAEGAVEVDDFDYLISNFTNNEQLSGGEYFNNDDWSSSYFVMMMGMDKSFDDLSHLNVLFSDNNEYEFIDIFEKKIPAGDMTIYISISKKTEKKDAPDGCENWLVYANAPYLTDKFRWTEENKLRYGDRIIERIDSFNYLFGDSIKNHIKFCDVFSPEDFLNEYNSERGSISGLSSNSIYTLLKRPKNKSRRFDNLFFTGGNTHPGAGVPLCFLSGKIVSGLVN